MRAVRILFVFVVALNITGCGTFVAHSLVRSPNRYPTWLAPRAPVTLAFSPKLLTNFPAHHVDVGPPSARLCYRIIDPADYGLKVTQTNWLTRQRKEYAFRFRATIPAPTNSWTATPRGTVLLLHGYGLAQFSMLPWALELAQDGWRCVLIDLRGHGKSTGKQIYFGLVETNDMSQLLDLLAQDKQMLPPVDVVGESYGAALALRWRGVDPRVQSVVAIAPYASLSNSILSISRQYAGWFPLFIIRSGVNKLPSVLHVSSDELDMTTVLRRAPVKALFIAGSEDTIAPTNDVAADYSLASPGSEMFVVPGATHEGLTYYFPELVPVILPWLDEGK
ncbi:MAG TPA: alpha/beta fold hydrolase [Verrucomicrobiae bacterium]|jgi:pimeloyl-ACP methyl ester carboxylesterase